MELGSPRSSRLRGLIRYHARVPRYQVSTLGDAPELVVRHWVCDGHDGRRVEPERMAGDRVMLPVAGRFAFRAPRARAVASPCEGLFIRDGATFEISHPHGEGDVCISLAGPLATRLVGAGPTSRPISLRAQLMLAGLARREPSPLEMAESLVLALAPPAQERPVRARDRALAERLAYEIARSGAEPLGLVELAARADVSVFHACRAFRRATGGSLHRFQRELRLRHALALVLGTDRPLVEIAYATGFANQGHFGNQFRERFGLSPGAARRTPQRISRREWPA